jgi:(2Fe-2S) ferredoxin
MYWNDKQVLVCTAIHCMKKGSSTVAGRLRIELKRRGLDHRIMCNTCDSIELCDMGPNMVVYPDGLIYRNVQVSDLRDIIAHLEGGPPVERLLISADSPDELIRRNFYLAIVERGGAVPFEEFELTAAEFGLDGAWINEQKARGFVAFKDADGQCIVHVTSKTTMRYCIDYTEATV